MKSSKANRRRLSVLPTILGIFLILLSGFALFASMYIDPSSGLLKRRGGVRYYSDAYKDGISLSLQGAGSDVWGFWEWPGARRYGFFTGTRGETGQIRANIGPGSSNALVLLIKEEKFGRILAGSIEESGKKIKTFELKEKRLSSTLDMMTFAGSVDESGHSASPLSGAMRPFPAAGSGKSEKGSTFYVSGISGHSAGMSHLFDRHLRRAKSVPEYAREYWGEFRARIASVPADKRTPDKRTPHVFWERQLFVSASASLYSIATERYVFEGGAHGVTVTVFKMFDGDSGKLIEPSDLFNDGWQGIVREKLKAEALRVLSEGDWERDAKSDGNGGNDASPRPPKTLRDFGFFEETIAPSSNFFACRSGVGFYYNRYELAPYSSGDFVFVIPWNELGQVLKNPAFGEGFGT